MQASALERIKTLAPRAVDVLEELLEDHDAGALRLAAARDILDRAGYKPQQRIDVTTAGESLLKPVPADDLALLHGDR